MCEKVMIRWDEEYSCYDVEINDPDATVAEFEEACQDLFSGAVAYRRYSESCLGCCICCSERIPVTRIDLLRVYELFHKNDEWDERDFRKWAEGISEIKRIGGCVDVTLGVDECSICRFWVREKGICSIYQARPFACRSYLCAPMSRRFEELRSQIINMGQDDLVPQLCEDVDEIYQNKNAFAKVNSYGDIMIKDICSKRLWRQLTDHRKD